MCSASMSIDWGRLERFLEDIQLPPKSLPLKLEEKHIERVNSALKTLSDTVYRRVVGVS